VALGGLLNQGAAMRIRAIMNRRFSKKRENCWWNRLKQAEEDGDGTEDGSGAGNLDGAGSALARLGAGGAAGGATVAVGVALRLVGVRRVALLTAASVGTLDGAVTLEVLKVGAGIVDVLGRDKSEGTTNVVQRRKIGTVSCQF
jgi:hypothetical protein